MQQITHCPVCDQQAFSKFATVDDLSISQETFKLDSCVSCGFVFTNPRPADSELSKYYQSEAYISHSGTRKGLINQLYHTVQQWNLRLKFKSITPFVPRGTWIDYGAGNGAFLNYINGKSIPSIGFEPSEDARNGAVKDGLNIIDTSKYSEYNSDIACITMWHVLEHVPNLNELFKIHADKLKPGGLLVIAVPNHHSYDAKFYRNFWAAYDVPRHLWHFTAPDVISLAEKVQLKHITTKGMPFDSYYISMLSEKYQKRSVIRGVVIGALSNIYARLSGYPFSSQIYIFKKNAV